MATYFTQMFNLLDLVGQISYIAYAFHFLLHQGANTSIHSKYKDKYDFKKELSSSNQTKLETEIKAVNQNLFQYLHLSSLMFISLRGIYTFQVFHQELRFMMEMLRPILERMSSFLTVYILYMILFAVAGQKTHEIDGFGTN